MAVVEQECTVCKKTKSWDWDSSMAADFMKAETEAIAAVAQDLGSFKPYNIVEGLKMEGESPSAKAAKAAAERMQKHHDFHYSEERNEWYCDECY